MKVSVRTALCAVMSLVLIGGTILLLSQDATAQRRPPPVKRPAPAIKDTAGLEMLLIPEGHFMMGRDSGPPDQAPAHRVYLTDYYIDKCEITNAQYEAFDPKHKRGQKSSGDNDPVTNVSYKDALRYCEWRGRKCRAKYSLPTEAQWEKAARGPKGFLYAWGDQYDSTKANVSHMKDKQWALSTAVKVGSYEPNAYGLYDMTGNVWEFCLDWYSKDYYSTTSKINPAGPGTGTLRVSRGGSAGSDWHKSQNDDRCACTYRGKELPETPSCLLGFRCVRLP